MKTPIFASTDIFDFVQTKDQAGSFVVTLQSMISLLYNQRYTVSQIFLENLSFTKQDKLIQLCKRFGIDLKKPSELETFLTQLIGAIQKYPVLILRVGFDPSERSLEVISRWLAARTSGMLLDITVDKRIIGGAVFGANGIYKDYSIRNMLLEVSKQVYDERDNKHE